jgi:PAS domain S-box-containing protein
MTASSTCLPPPSPALVRAIAAAAPAGWSLGIRTSAAATVRMRSARATLELHRTGPAPRRAMTMQVLILDRDATRHGEYERTPWPGSEVSCCDGVDRLAGRRCDVVLVVDDDQRYAGEACRAARRAIAERPLIGVLCPHAGEAPDGCDLVIRSPTHPAIARIALRSMVKLRAALLSLPEQPIAAAEDERQEYFALSPDLCCTLDTYGRFVDANETFVRASGIALADLMQLSCLPLCHPEDRSRAEHGLVQLTRGGVLTDFECRMRWADGDWHWMNWTIIPSPDRVAFYATGRDITRRREDDRRAALAAESLSRANTELERFAYAASHDLKEPMRMISSYLDLLRRRHQGELGSEGKEFMDFCIDAVERLRATLDTLLTYATSGSADWHPAPVRLRHPLVQAMRNLDAAIAAADAAISFPAELPLVHGNDVLLALLFQNLLQNSLKYRSQQKPRITVSVVSDGETCTVSVADNGIGIAAGDLDRVFEAFARAAPGGAGSGSGIGLATCRRIVERHGGRIWAESAPGAGTTVRFTLPLLS